MNAISDVICTANGCCMPGKWLIVPEARLHVESLKNDGLTNG
jgi:hypothetical protein